MASASTTFFRRGLVRSFQHAALIALTLGSVPVFAQTHRTPDELAQARDAYNEQRYSDAIRLATDAAGTPAQKAAADVVLARAYLERYRQTSVVADLDQARVVLQQTIDAASLDARDRVELLVAYGQSLYFDEAYSLDDRFSAAAELFEVALARADLLDAAGRDRLFEWWAGALDRQAQQGPETMRRPLYDRILRRAEAELARDDGALAAIYWLAASARGTSDLARAMGAAAGGWVRAASYGARGEALRADLDRLMQQVILPERALQLTAEGDPRSALALLEGQWQEFKGKWTAIP